MIPKTVTFYQGDVGNHVLLDHLFKKESIDAVIHCAGLISVSESVAHPKQYYDNNLMQSITLLETMHRHHIHKLILSSTAAVYGMPKIIPIPESHIKNPISPYAKSKWMFEELLMDYAEAYGLHYIILRYFNAAGANPEAGLGEYRKTETHLIPLALQALQQGTSFTIFGNDYETPDGTAIRDYIHIKDLVIAHTLALNKLLETPMQNTYNIGTSIGHSVNTVLTYIANITGQTLPTIIQPKRPGDCAMLVADSKAIQNTLNWQPQYSSLTNIIQDAWWWTRKLHDTALQPAHHNDSSPIV